MKEQRIQDNPNFSKLTLETGKHRAFVFCNKRELTIEQVLKELVIPALQGTGYDKDEIEKLYQRNSLTRSSVVIAWT